MLDIFDNLDIFANLGSIIRTHDNKQIGLSQGEDFKEFEHKWIQNIVAYAPDLTDNNNKNNNVKSIIEGLDESSVEKQNAPVDNEMKNNINDLENNFNSKIAEYTRIHKLFVEESIENTALQEKTNPLYGKTITADNKNYAYINNFGYKHEYSDAWASRNNRCIGKTAPCPDICKSCKSGYVDKNPDSEITIISHMGTYFSILANNTLMLEC